MGRARSGAFQLRSAGPARNDRTARRAQEARPDAVIDEVFDLFAALDADEGQLDFPILYGSAKQGWMATSPDGPKEDMAALRRHRDEMQGQT